MRHESLLTDLDPVLQEAPRRRLAAVPPLAERSAVPTLVSATRTGRARDDRHASDEDGASDVFVCCPPAADSSALSSLASLAADELTAATVAAAARVTLFVYGWHNVEPGPLSWVFPSLRAALEAVRTMRNAIEWSICSGAEWTDIEAARARGAILVEQSA